MSFSLPDLPYPHDALAPYMSRETLEYHHDKHHQAYVTNGNNLLKGSEWEGKSLEEVVKGSYGKNAGLFNNAGQHWNHNHFWKWMKPGGGGDKIPGNLEKKIAADLLRDRFKPPRVRDFASVYATPEANVRKLLRQLARIGRIVEVAPDQFFLRPVVAEMIGIAHGLGDDFTAAQFRDRLDNGRKLAILILEFFDRHGITVRRGDQRRTVPAKLEQYGPVTKA